MNQPIEQRFTKLEQRVMDIEHTFKEVIKNEEQLIRLSQRHRHIVEGIALDIGDARERFDTIERTQAEHGEVLKGHGEMLKGHGEMLESHSGRFDTIERTQAEHGEV